MTVKSLQKRGAAARATSGLHEQRGVALGRLAVRLTSPGQIRFRHGIRFQTPAMVASPTISSSAVNFSILSLFVIPGGPQKDSVFYRKDDFIAFEMPPSSCFTLPAQRAPSFFMVRCKCDLHCRMIHGYARLRTVFMTFNGCGGLPKPISRRSSADGRLQPPKRNTASPKRAFCSSNENKMSDGGRERASLGMERTGKP